ncbi:MAG: phosphoribosylformylglycinamidine synthase I [Herpetosiphonaceae bacterium]|nr:phosphoribosylformylglycinamidine synthase I [Herpetosiphonaceae bacterium]
MTVNAPRILVLRAAGINCDHETAAAVTLAGGHAELVHINRLAEGTVDLKHYAGLIIPGGFSYGDHLGAGKLLAVDLIYRLGSALERFIADGHPVLGICNGFQVLVKAGLLGLEDSPQQEPAITLTTNQSGHYECRWVRLVAPLGQQCIFLRDISAPFELPVGHGEGRLVAGVASLVRLEQQGQIALRYVDRADQPTLHYPANPNGAAGAIAGVSNRRGNVLGLMPHPDRAFLPQLHPDWVRNKQRRQGDGLPIFRNMVQYAASLS